MNIAELQPSGKVRHAEASVVRKLRSMLLKMLPPGLVFGLYATLPQQAARSVFRMLGRVSPLLVPSSLGFAVVSIVIFEMKSVVSLSLGVTIQAAAMLLLILYKKERLVSRLRQVERMAAERGQRSDIPAPPLWAEYPVSDTVRRTVDAARKGQREFLLARIDADGRAHCEYGDLPCLTAVSQNNFVMRDRYDIDIVVYSDSILLRKNYRGRKSTCLREWYNLEQMAGKVNVPIVRMVDMDSTLLYMDFICGRTALELLRSKGLLMNNSDAAHDLDFASSDSEAPQRKREPRGKPLLKQCFSEKLFIEFDELIDAVHRCRVADLDLCYTNILVDRSGKPWMVDFHDARVFPGWAEWLFRIKCDSDYLNHNRLFQRNKLTEGTARQLLATVKREVWHSPVDFGNGLTKGNVFDHEKGMARWQPLIAENFPELTGKRVFVVNGGNGVLPLLLLRAGAKAVVASEKNKAFCDASVVTQRAFEWRDLRTYDFTPHHGDARCVCLNGNSEFDIVVADMSLDHFYLKELEQVSRFSSAIGAVLIIAIDEGDVTRKNKMTMPDVVTNVMSLMSVNHFDSTKIVSKTSRSVLIVAEHGLQKDILSLNS